MSDARSLLPPTAPPLLRVVERVIGDTDATMPAAVGSLWDVDRCPVALLPWLAWSLSVEVWDHAWSETVKRSVVREAIAVHRLKGTRQALETALATLGFSIQITEAWEEGAIPHTFRLSAYGDDAFAAGLQVDAKLVDTINRLVRNVKPVRSRFSLGIGETFRDRVFLRAGLRQMRRHQQDLAPVPRPHEASDSVSLRVATRARRIDRHAHVPLPRPHVLAAGIVARSASRSRITSRMDHEFQPGEGAAYAIDRH